MKFTDEQRLEKIRSTTEKPLARIQSSAPEESPWFLPRAFFEMIMAVTLREAHGIMYPFLTLDDGTEIVHWKTLPDGCIKVCMERPDETQGFFIPAGP